MAVPAPSAPPLPPPCVPRSASRTSLKILFLFLAIVPLIPIRAFLPFPESLCLGLLWAVTGFTIWFKVNRVVVLRTRESQGAPVLVVEQRVSPPPRVVGVNTVAAPVVGGVATAFARAGVGTGPFQPRPGGVWRGVPADVPSRTGPRAPVGARR